jgi:hypothetical protein
VRQRALVQVAVDGSGSLMGSFVGIVYQCAGIANICRRLTAEPEVRAASTNGEQD